jgi:hypothetical protein
VRVINRLEQHPGHQPRNQFKYCSDTGIRNYRLVWCINACLIFMYRHNPWDELIPSLYDTITIIINLPVTPK